MSKKTDETNIDSTAAFTILGVAVAAIVQVVVTDGAFTFWNIMVGVVLILILTTYHPRLVSTKRELFALSSVWGLTAIIAAGLPLQELYRNFFLKTWPSLPPFHKDEAPGLYYFIWWIILSAGACLAIAKLKSKSQNKLDS